MKTRILLVDDDTKLLEREVEFFGGRDDYEVVGSASGGEQAITLFDSLEPDVMVLDMLMPGKDGMAVLDSIAKTSGRIVAVSGVMGERLAGDAIDAGADYFLLKPFELDDLERRISSLRRKSPRHGYEPALTGGRAKGRIEQRITDIFMTVGIPAHIKGYQFLREAIKMAIDCPEIINSITKRLYPEVAQRFETSPSKVERAIRHAIEVAWNKGKIENINSIFGIKVYSSTEKPTNGEFIALVADKMLLENA